MFSLRHASHSRNWGETDKIIAGGEWKKMKMNPDCWWFMVIMVTLYPLLLWLLVISLLSAYCIFFIWLHSTSDLHSIHFQAAGILQVFIFLLFNLRNIYSWWNVSDNLGKSSKKIKLWTISHPSRPTPSVKKKCVLNDSKYPETNFSHFFLKTSIIYSLYPECSLCGLVTPYKSLPSFSQQQILLA